MKKKLNYEMECLTTRQKIKQNKLDNLIPAGSNDCPPTGDCGPASTCSPWQS